MFGPGMIQAINAAASVRYFMDKHEDFLYTADEIAIDAAYAAGWRQDDQGVWTDEHGDEADAPLDMLMNHNLPNDLQDAIVDACVEAYNAEYGEDKRATISRRTRSRTAKPTGNCSGGCTVSLCAPRLRARRGCRL